MMPNLNPFKRNARNQQQQTIPLQSTVARPVTETTLADAYKAEFKGHTLNRRFDDLNTFRGGFSGDNPVTEQDIAINQILVGHGEGALGQSAKLIPKNWYAQVNLLRRAYGQHARVDSLRRELKQANVDRDEIRIKTLQRRIVKAENYLGVLRAICDTVRIEQIPRTIYDKDRDVNVVTKNEIDPQLLLALLVDRNKSNYSKGI